MKEVIETIIQSLVSDKDSVSIQETENEKRITFEVKVANQDMGKVIGKDGKVAKAIRTVMKAVATKENKRATIEFIE